MENIIESEGEQIIIDPHFKPKNLKANKIRTKLLIFINDKLIEENKKSLFRINSLTLEKIRIKYTDDIYIEETDTFNGYQNVSFSTNVLALPQINMNEYQLNALTPKSFNQNSPESNLLYRRKTIISKELFDNIIFSPLIEKLNDINKNINDSFINNDTSQNIVNSNDINNENLFVENKTYIEFNKATNSYKRINRNYIFKHSCRYLKKLVKSFLVKYPITGIKPKSTVSSNFLIYPSGI